MGSLTKEQWKGCIMMCRYGDEGAYELGNIYKGSQSDQNKDWHTRKSA